MRSPFPGMNPYLENPELWPEVHSRLIVAIADVIAPHVRPKYRVAVEKRVYQVTDENFVLVGIPDVSVGRSLTKTETELSSIALASAPVKPITVNVPMPEEVREGYLEVREVGTGEVVTVIEVLYDRAGLDLAIDYTREPVPPLSAADGIWVDALLKEQELR